MKDAPSATRTRRAVLRGLGCCVVASAVVPSSIAARPARVALSTERLGPQLAWIRGAGCNVLALKDAQGLAFIDGGMAANAKSLEELARAELGAGPAHTLINTHWHPEHVGLNETLGRNGAKIVAHANTRLWLSTPVERKLDGPVVAPLSPKGLPNETTYGEGEIRLGDEVVQYGYLSQAHTDGDLYVHLRNANVLMTGGVVAGNGWSVVDYVTGGWINGLVGGYRTLAQRCTADTRVISAYGDRILTRKDLEGERDMLAKLSDQLGKMLRSGFGPADVLAAAPAREFEPRYGDSTEFLDQSFRSLWGHMAPDA
jgi:glyoxylase-like metal-dependent hydrolase (beta-lactamase superfamily II)